MASGAKEGLAGAQNNISGCVLTLILPCGARSSFESRLPGFVETRALDERPLRRRVRTMDLRIETSEPHKEVL